MYRALYRKWRPRRFDDVVGQQAIVTALQNQVANDRVGHAYLFTGVRGTGKTTCAKIFAKAVNCLNPVNGDPCCECELCRGIDDGSMLDVVEMDAASNNGVDDIRDIRDETNYTPSQGRRKVYIIDEVHMLSGSAFNALLKTLEEPPSHVIFILATTEIHKVPATILSRCQRYDFGRIRPEDIATRVAYIAGEENIELTAGAADMISRLADGALRDALSILDTCAGVSARVDEDVVRRMAGVTDKSYLFRLSDALRGGKAVEALAELAALRQQSVDMKRLCEELIAHYRNLMLAALPGGQALLSGVSPEEEPQYLEKARQHPQRESIRAVRRLGEALEKMGRGTDQRVELELALFALAQPEAQPVTIVQAAPAPSQPFAAAPIQPFAAAPVVPVAAPPAPVPAAPAVPAEPAPMPAPQPVPPAQDAVPEAPSEPMPWDEPMQAAPAPVKVAAAPAPAAEPAYGKPEYTADQPLAASQPAKAKPIEPFDRWPDVVNALAEKDKMLGSFLQGSKAYFDGKRVLFECNDLFREYINKKENAGSKESIRQAIADVTGVRCGIGPYTPPKETAKPQTVSAEDTLRALASIGVDVVVNEKE